MRININGKTIPLVMKRVFVVSQPDSRGSESTRHITSGDSPASLLLSGWLPLNTFLCHLSEQNESMYFYGIGGQ